MGTNKIYEVERIELNSKVSDTIYAGRIRDCKNSLQRIEEAYKARGFTVLNIEFTLFIYTSNTLNANWAYVIRRKK